MSAISNFKATHRLEKAGSGSFESIKRRIEYIAMERNIPAAELPPVLAGIKRSSGPSYPRVIEFCDVHGISLDWLHWRPADVSHDGEATGRADAGAGADSDASVAAAGEGRSLSDDMFASERVVCEARRFTLAGLIARGE